MMYKIISVQNKSSVFGKLISRFFRTIRNFFRTQKKPDRVDLFPAKLLNSDIISLVMGFFNEADQANWGASCWTWYKGYHGWLTIEVTAAEKKEELLRETMPKGHYFGLEELELYFSIKLSAREKIAVMARVNLEELINFLKGPYPIMRGQGLKYEFSCDNPKRKETHTVFLRPSLSICEWMEIMNNTTYTNSEHTDGKFHDRCRSIKGKEEAYWAKKRPELKLVVMPKMMLLGRL